jgi:hypothetical protein
VESVRLATNVAARTAPFSNGPSTASPVLGPFSFDTRGGEPGLKEAAN